MNKLKFQIISCPHKDSNIKKIKKELEEKINLLNEKVLPLNNKFENAITGIELGGHFDYMQGPEGHFIANTRKVTCRRTMCMCR